MGKDVFSAKICEKLINIKLLTVNYQLSTKFCNFALANQRRAPLCERQALFASCETLRYIALANRTIDCRMV